MECGYMEWNGIGMEMNMGIGNEYGNGKVEMNEYGHRRNWECE